MGVTMSDRPPKRDSATRHSQYTATIRQVQITELLIEAEQQSLHLVTAAMLVSVSSAVKEVRNG
jgi:hypothetical protein